MPRELPVTARPCVVGVFGERVNWMDQWAGVSAWLIGVIFLGVREGHFLKEECASLFSLL